MPKFVYLNALRCSVEKSLDSIRNSVDSGDSQPLFDDLVMVDAMAASALRSSTSLSPGSILFRDLQSYQATKTIASLLSSLDPRVILDARPTASGCPCLQPIDCFIQSGDRTVHIANALPTCRQILCCDDSSVAMTSLQERCRLNGVAGVF